MTQWVHITTGIAQLDRILGGLYIGDNVVWYDNAGSLASAFCDQFIATSQNQSKSIIYASFDRSPRYLLEKLGTAADNPDLTILDCFTWGKGAASPVFLKFYDEPVNAACRIIKVEDPRSMKHVMDALYCLHDGLTGDVRLVFESVTGMQELWGGEDHILKFYSHSCPRLYELRTIAYWILEKRAHSPRLKAHISQIAQVVIDLSIRRGTTSLTVLKADQRDPGVMHRPFTYWTKDGRILFEEEKRSKSGIIDLGARIKAMRSKRGMSQKELANRVGVTPSTISQVESDLIYPSLPALLKMAEVLSMEVGSFFQEPDGSKKRIRFPASESTQVRIGETPENGVQGKLLTPVDLNEAAEPYLIEILANRSISSHFFPHKGEEMGYLISGKLQMVVEEKIYNLRSGDTVYLTTEVPSKWLNPGPGAARLLWVKIKSPRR